MLVNPNIATIQTSDYLADQVYFLPVTAALRGEGHSRRKGPTASCSGSADKPPSIVAWSWSGPVC